jgi:hypothetical protein
MKYVVLSLDRLIEDVGVKNVAAEVEHPDAGIPENLPDILMVSAGEVVKDDNLVNVLLGEFLDYVRSDEAGSSDYEYLRTFQ